VYANQNSCVMRIAEGLEHFRKEKMTRLWKARQPELTAEGVGGPGQTPEVFEGPHIGLVVYHRPWGKTNCVNERQGQMCWTKRESTGG